jgi:nitroreductase
LEKNQKALDNLMQRTCCRRFSDLPVSDEDIKKILKAGQAAPSAKNRQPYYFIVIKNKECRLKIVEAAQKGRQKQFSNLTLDEAAKKIYDRGQISSNDMIIPEAAAAILVMRDTDINYKEGRMNELDIKEEQGVACACYSMMLGAFSLGIGMAWICSVLYFKEELKTILEEYGIKWKDTWQPRVIMPLGYPVAKLMKPQRKALEEISYFIE